MGALCTLTVQLAGYIRTQMVSSVRCLWLLFSQLLSFLLVPCVDIVLYPIDVRCYQLFIVLVFDLCCL